MALTLVSTLSSETANSYCDISYCDDYWAQHYSSTKADLWAALTTPQKTMLLIQACRSIERLRFTVTRNSNTEYTLRHTAIPGLIAQYITNVVPVKDSYTQALQFPRNVDRNSEGVQVIPEPVKLAQCEQAVYLLSFDESVMASRLQGIDSESTSVGSVSVKQTFSGSATALSPMALEYVGPFLLRTSAVLRRS